MKRFLGFLFALPLLGASAYGTDTASHAVELTVADTCRVGLNSTAKVSLVVSAPDAGETPAGSTDASKSLRYTSIVPRGGSRRITVNWNPADAAPDGTSLALRASNPPAGGGTSAGRVIVGAEPRDLIVGIGSCATGTASGPALVYSFDVDDPSRLVVGETRTVTVHFTLTDA